VSARPVLFLDFDGVLNSRRYFEATANNHLDTDAGALDPIAVERLNRVIDATEAEIVVSSAWRLINTVGSLQRTLRARGFRHRIRSRTPVHYVDRGRYMEIREWLFVNAHGGPFAIVDDDHDAGISYAPRFVQTTFDEGLTDAHVEKLIEILRRADEP
jgi:hypothetical protein